MLAKSCNIVIVEIGYSEYEHLCHWMIHVADTRKAREHWRKCNLTLDFYSVAAAWIRIHAQQSYSHESTEERLMLWVGYSLTTSYKVIFGGRFVTGISIYCLYLEKCVWLQWRDNGPCSKMDTFQLEWNLKRSPPRQDKTDYRDKFYCQTKLRLTYLPTVAISSFGAVKIRFSYKELVAQCLVVFCTLKDRTMKIKKSLHIPQLYFKSTNRWLKLKISNDTNHAHGESFKLKNTVALKHHHVQIMHRHNFDSADQRTFTVSLTLCIKLM